MGGGKISKQRLGGLALAATRDPMEYTAKARATFEQKFLEQVDPDGSLRRKNPKEAARRATAARKLFYTRLAFQSVKTRAAKKKRFTIARAIQLEQKGAA
jgi:hypothetical protein